MRVQLEVPLIYGDAEIGDTIWLAHRMFPTPDKLGSEEAPPLRAPLIVLEKEWRLTQRKLILTCLDPTVHACSYWCPAATDIGSDINDRGIARLDRGGGEVHVRAQTGYVRRPPDGLWTDRIDNTPRYFGLVHRRDDSVVEGYGLAVCGGDQLWHANNTFGHGTFPTVTGWVLTENGTGTIEENTTDLLFDFGSNLRSLTLTNGATPATDNCWLARTEAVEANRHIRVFAKYKTDGEGDNRPRYRVVRSVDNFEWTTIGWVGAANQWLPPNNMGLVGAGPDFPDERVEFWSENIPVGANATNITIYFGKSDGANIVTTAYAAGFTKSESGISQSFARDFIPTLGGPTVQATEQPAINNDTGFLVLSSLRGTVNFVAVPMWSDADLVVGTRKILFQTMWDANGGFGAGIQFDAVYYVKDSTTVSRLVFLRRIVGFDEWSAEVELTGDYRALYLRPMKIALRWTSHLGEARLTPTTMTIFVDGRQGSTPIGPVQISILGSRIYFRGISLDGGITLESEEVMPDCWFRNIEFRQWPLRNEQILRTLG